MISIIRLSRWPRRYCLLAYAAALMLGLGFLRSPLGSGSSVGTVAMGALPHLRALFFRPAKPSGPSIVMPSEETQVISVVKKSSGAVVSVIAAGQVPKLVPCGAVDGNASLCQSGTELQRTGTGSGFIVSPDGYIITNRHVVADENSAYTVVLNDQKNAGKTFHAKVLVRDPNQDIAFLKIDVHNLPFLPFGDSSKLQVGQTAIAIGNALGEFDNTVSKGVVSGLSRSINAADGLAQSEELHGLIQTDAAINPGNSGGPLLDSSGNVIGMNTAMANAQSIGFAIPVNEIKTAYAQVRATGDIPAAPQSFLGVRFQPITPELQTNLKLPFDHGMLIGKGTTETDAAIMPGSPADTAGLQEKDIILEADGRELNERYLLSDAVRTHQPGDMMRLKIYRQGVTEDLTVILRHK